MSRLDAEYNPAEHHDLAQVYENIPEIHFPVTYGWLCECGEYGKHEDWKTRRGARRAHERHREQRALER